jgi:hypothetical protein
MGPEEQVMPVKSNKTARGSAMPLSCRVSLFSLRRIFSLGFCELGDSIERLAACQPLGHGEGDPGGGEVSRLDIPLRLEAAGRAIEGSCGSMCLVSISLLVFLLMPGGGLVHVASAQGPPEERPPVKKMAPAYTDEDLARYREQRLREERGESSPTAETPAGAPEDAVGAPVAEANLPRASPDGVSVVLQDLNRTLPPDAREKAEAAARRFVTFFDVPIDGPLLVPLRFFPDDKSFRDHLARNVQKEVTWTGY